MIGRNLLKGDNFLMTWLVRKEGVHWILKHGVPFPEGGYMRMYVTNSFVFPDHVKITHISEFLFFVMKKGGGILHYYNGSPIETLRQLYPEVEFKDERKGRKKVKKW
jgi:hypothetical protein